VQRRRVASAGNDQLHLTLNEIRQQLWQSVVLTSCPTVLNQDVATLDEAAFAQALVKCSHKPRERASWRKIGAAYEPDHRHRGLLCSRRQRPNRSRAAEKGDEFSTPHSITCQRWSERAWFNGTRITNVGRFDLLDDTK
jgi:hypothetical protein